MIYPIYTYGEDILRKKVEDVDLKNPTLPQLISDMFETMHNANGAGLAGPQIGLNRRIVVIEEEIETGVIFKIVLINPKIINYIGHLFYSMNEGCLSFPELTVQVNRPRMVEIEWYDEHNVCHKEIFDGIQSRILQHEIEHLDGILFIDRMYPEDRLKIFMQLEDIKNKKIQTTYPIK
jgi:peptide deformylase